MKKTMFLICCLLWFTNIYSQSVSFNLTNSSSVEFDFNLPPYSVRDTVLPAEYGISRIFSYIKMNDDAFGLIDSVGLPLLPQLTIDVHVPIGATDFSISLSSCQFTYFNITNPILPALRDICTDSVVYVFNMDSTHYASDNPFMPIGAVIMDEYIVFGEKGLSVAINPYEYEPACSRIKVLTQGSITISFSTNPSINIANPHRSTASVEHYLSTLFSNYIQQNVRETDMENYLIITAPLFENAISAFADYKENLGYHIYMVTTDVTGTSETAIKNYIQNRYNNESTRPEYVLLVGGSSYIPASDGSSGDDDDPVTDLYYTTLDGDDFKSDVFLGRFSVSSVNDLYAIINKTLYMETNLSGMTKKATFIAGEENDNNWMERQFEKGHDYVVDETFSPLGFTCSKLYQPNIGQVYQNLSGNPLYFIYSGHGGINRWAGNSFAINKDTLSKTANTYFPFVFSFSCWTGSFADASCICNSWMNIPDKGAVTYFGSSVRTFCHSDLVIEKKIFDSQFSTDVSIASVVYHGMDKFRTHFWGWFNRGRILRFLKSYNLLGDPSLIMGGVDCFYDYVFYRNVSISSGGDLNIQAEHLIRNNNAFTVNNGASVSLQAGEEIVLTDGFYAAEGSDFEAVIAPCSGRTVQQSMAERNTVLPMHHAYMPQQDSSSTSVSEPESGRALKIWPNPVSGLLHLQLPDGESEVERIVVSDMLGRVMLRKDRVTGSGIDVSALPAGMYLLKLQTAAGKACTGKFVKD